MRTISKKMLCFCIFLILLDFFTKMFIYFIGMLIDKNNLINFLNLINILSLIKLILFIIFVTIFILQIIKQYTEFFRVKVLFKYFILLITFLVYIPPYNVSNEWLLKFDNSITLENKLIKEKETEMFFILNELVQVKDKNASDNFFIKKLYNKIASGYFLGKENSLFFISNNKYNTIYCYLSTQEDDYLLVMEMNNNLTYRFVNLPIKHNRTDIFIKKINLLERVSQNSVDEILYKN